MVDEDEKKVIEHETLHHLHCIQATIPESHMAMSFLAHLDHMHLAKLIDNPKFVSAVKALHDAGHDFMEKALKVKEASENSIVK